MPNISEYTKDSLEEKFKIRNYEKSTSNGVTKITYEYLSRIDGFGKGVLYGSVGTLVSYKTINLWPVVKFLLSTGAVAGSLAGLLLFPPAALGIGIFATGMNEIHLKFRLNKKYSF